MRIAHAALGALLLFALGTTANAATFTIRPQAGFDDQTPVTPTGGNTATTLGQARLNVLNEAGRIWGSLLVSNVPIVVDATFGSLDCDATSATLAATKPTAVFAVNGPIPNVFYVSALADAIRGTDLMPNMADIAITVNSRLNSDPMCIGAGQFYLGFDHNPPFGQQDLLAVVLHEFAHGLGFVSLVDLDPSSPTFGTNSSGKLSSYDQFVFDEVLGRAWTALTTQERQTSASRTRQVAWNGTNVNSNLAFLTGGRGRSAGNRLLLFTPAMVAAGASIAHFDDSATPNILMEPNLTPGLPGYTDVTVCALKDIGWQVTRCPDFTSNSSTSSPPPVTATPQPPVATTPPPTTTNTGGGKRHGGGGALYLPLLLALAGLVPLRSRLRRRQRC